jgi:hypothetical protein
MLAKGSLVYPVRRVHRHERSLTLIYNEEILFRRYMKPLAQISKTVWRVLMLLCVV